MRRERAGALVVFAKAPRPGHVKTRLCPPWSQRRAAEFYAAMLFDVLVASGEYARRLDLDALVAVEPWKLRGGVTAMAPPCFRVVPQRGGDLSARMAWAVREVVAGGARRVLLRGSDTPTLDEAAVAGALSALDDCDLVLQPDRDGGYGLVGLRAPTPGLFDHPMSSDRALDDTLANARRAGLRTRVTAPGFDIDRPGDLADLARARAAGACAACPRTLAYLDAGALWPGADGA